MKEEEIRPQVIFDEYLSLAERDIQKYFSDGPRTEISCPACRYLGVNAFEKEDFSYQECPSCYTLIVSPLPSAETFSSYYRESESATYWATTFY